MTLTPKVHTSCLSLVDYEYKGVVKELACMGISDDVWSVFVRYCGRNDYKNAMNLINGYITEEETI